MQTRIKRACGIAAAGLLTALATSGVFADTPRPESSLLGIHLLASFSDVMQKFGQPNEIQVGEPTISGQGQSAPAGGMARGGQRMGGMPGGMMGGPGMMSSSMGSGGGMMGASMGVMAPPPSMSSSMGGRSFPGGLPGMAGASGSSLPGLGGSRPGGMAGGPGMMGGAGNSSAGAEDSGESTWWYHFPHEGLHYSFLFNKDGRVIQIQAYGQKPAAKIVAPRTAEGITLGADLGQVIRRYGWSNTGDHSGDYVVMRYADGRHDEVAFQTRHNKVLGIVLGRVNPQAPQTNFAGAQGGYPGGYPGGGGGYPGGMMGMSSSMGGGGK